MPANPPIRPLSVTETGHARTPIAGGVRAGDWVFASSRPRAFGHSRRPRSGEPPALIQARSVWQGAAETLAEGGSDVSRMVRCDQFFTDWRAVPFFHQARRAACGQYIAPSTSILQPEMSVPGAAMSMDLVAVADGGPAIEPIFPKGLDIPSTSSFVPVVRAGDLVFVAGFLAAHGEGDLGGVAPEAKVPEGHLWKGNRIQLETGYIIREKLVPALAGAGLTLADVVKASVFLCDIEDVPTFNQVWKETFGENIPATTITPTSQPGFAIADSRIEINLIATRERAKVQRIDTERAAPAVCDGHPVALRVGDLLLFSGLAASDRNGAVGVGVDAQMNHLIDIAEDACERAGTSLRNAVRIGQLHTDLSDFAPACKVWQERLPGVPLPLSATRVPGPLIVPGCFMQLDLWVYVP
jgi:enamine deaminase RidA (YjgF/YER057c/UK114 family)